MLAWLASTIGLEDEEKKYVGEREQAEREGGMMLLASPDSLDVYFSVHQIPCIGIPDGEASKNYAIWKRLFGEFVDHMNSHPTSCERTLIFAHDRQLAHALFQWLMKVVRRPSLPYMAMVIPGWGANPFRSSIAIKPKVRLLVVSQGFGDGINLCENYNWKDTFILGCPPDIDSCLRIIARSREAQPGRCTLIYDKLRNCDKEVQRLAQSSLRCRWELLSDKYNVEVEESLRCCDVCNPHLKQEFEDAPF